jgi:SPP1 gp7 family putative phage head morphogenesis protein
MRGSSKTAAAFYRELRVLMGPVVQSVEDMTAWLASNPGPATAMAALTAQKEQWRRVLGPSIRAIARKWVELESETDRRRLEQQIAKALQVDVVSIFDDEALLNAVELMQVQAVNLITTMPDMYFDKVAMYTMQSYQQERLPEGRSLTEQLRELHKQTYERAKLIAVDQTQKLHCAVTQARQTSLGIEEYIWRTSNDERVVGTPGGVSPQGNPKHENHYVRNGRKFRWDSPPSDGHPGWPIRCRCWADPVIDYSKLNLR